MTFIHKLAVVSPKAELGKDVYIGPYSVVNEDVIIGDGTHIAEHAIIRPGARIGTNCKIFSGAIISEISQDLKYKGEKTETFIGDRTIVREYATIHKGTAHRMKTVVGSDCLLMAYVHIAHDCIIGNNCIISNATQLAGHVRVEDKVTIGGMTGIHQFVQIGTHAFVGGYLRVGKDIPPYILAAGVPARFAGINHRGLERAGFSSDVIKTLKEFYHIIYRSEYNVSDALKYIENNVELIPETKHAIEFIKSSQRGLI
ncbi:MAG: acyl-ACP--UDP-N-acetylglucosamine O-acyltransferase [Candidatus Marinimicrobia bacterium]|nr:acyl-ACP--UDP-N-acetylglucosamine O-acyltransferase [Candidatus Neomarinimicrobiota bacterium]MDD5583145.1 acyl-ACP--UDP-N-acetylglucosamine O-acyltransferase [Candidatus Neomarinimicrobiota bacterium]